MSNVGSVIEEGRVAVFVALEPADNDADMDGDADCDTDAKQLRKGFLKWRSNSIDTIYFFDRSKQKADTK